VAAVAVAKVLLAQVGRVVLAWLFFGINLSLCFWPFLKSKGDKKSTTLFNRFLGSQGKSSTADYQEIAVENTLVCLLNNIVFCQGRLFYAANNGKGHETLGTINQGQSNFSATFSGPIHPIKGKSG
jgi:hypothetical protein